MKTLNLSEDEWYPVLTEADGRWHEHSLLVSDELLARVRRIEQQFRNMQDDLRTMIEAEPVMLAIAQALTPDLLKPKFHIPGQHPLYGHCYVAAEALYHALGRSGLTPHRAKDNVGVTHWWLQRGKLILDPTAAQYLDRGLQPPYKRGKGGGFLTREPSARAAIVLERMKRNKETVVIPH